MSKCPLQTLPDTAQEWEQLPFTEKVNVLFNEEWLPDVNPSNLWYHYTTIDALPTMITDKGVELWATHSSFVNDKEEIKLGAQHIAKLLKSITTEEKVMRRYDNSVFISCLSQEKDSIPMWNAYGGGGNGIALGFKPHIPQIGSTHQYMKVIYEGTIAEDQWINRVTEYMQKKNKLDNLSGMLSILYLPMAYKHYKFAYEKEIRFLYFDDSEPTFFRNRKGLLVPYKKMYVGCDKLSEIMIGPTADGERTELAIRLLLEQKGMSDIQITHSSAPLRQ